jgi:hypothetical protein
MGSYLGEFLVHKLRTSLRFDIVRGGGVFLYDLYLVNCSPQVQVEVVFNVE